MAITRGSELRLYVNTAGATYTSLDCEVDATLAFAVEEADTTGKCSSGWKTGVKTIRSATLSGSGHYNAGDTGVDFVRDSVLSLSGTAVQFKSFGSEMFTGTFNFNAFDITAAYNGVVDFTFSANSTGEVKVETAV